MTDRVIKPLSEITRSEWILYRWVEITTREDTELMYIRGDERTLDEAKAADENFMLYLDAHSTVMARQGISDGNRYVRVGAKKSGAINVPFYYGT